MSTFVISIGKGRKKTEGYISLTERVWELCKLAQLLSLHQCNNNSDYETNENISMLCARFHQFFFFCFRGPFTLAGRWSTPAKQENIHVSPDAVAVCALSPNMHGNHIIFCVKFCVMQISTRSERTTTTFCYDYGYF